MITEYPIIFDRKKHVVGLIAPASLCRDFDDITIKIKQFFTKNKMKCQIDDHLIKGPTLPFYSNDIKFRLLHMKQLLDDNNVKILWCLRGGYGSSELLYLLKNYEVPQNKILIGFSDITSLHILFNNNFSMPSIHGPNANHIVSYQSNMKYIVDILRGKILEYTLKQINNIKYHFIQDAQIIGGNLTVLCSNIGCFEHEYFNNKILFLEDINEKSYSLMRSLMQLYHNGLLINLKAIIFGDFIQSDQFLEQSLEFFVRQYCQHIPVFTTHNIGHGKINYPLIFAAKSEVKDDILQVHSPYKMIN